MTRTLIINADDLGYDPAVSRGILEAMNRGVVSSTTLMVNTPSSADAALLARGKAVGLHLNLARYAPVWKAFPPALLGEGAFLERRAGELPPAVVEQETLAQLDRLRELFGAPATHIDVHKHLHLHAPVLAGVAAAARARKLPVRSKDAQMREALQRLGVRTNDGFLGDAGAEPYWTLPRLRAELATLGPGVTELMCHPGYAPEAVKSGYAAQREVELETFTHEGARRLLERAGATLADFRVLQG